ncbi:MAG: T9SS type A sorting domain-containing protein [Flavobacteriales bacterium]
MKRISILVGTFAIALGTSAQRIPATYPSALSPVTDVELGGSRSATVDVAPASERGSVFFMEDFSNGLAGSNGFGPMTTEDSGGNTIWMMANSNSPGGEFSSTIAALGSPTAANGWVIFDCDLFNTPISDGVEDVTGSLSTPGLDCSELSSVIVEYYQYFRYCCFPTSPLTLEVSTDGGTNWTVYPAQGSFFPSANTLSANPLYTKVDISCAAAGQSNVIIRWGYNLAAAAGYSHYFWGLDDIAIYENPVANDLELVQTVNGDVFADWEFRVIPFEQRVLAADGGILAGAIYRNNGSSDQTNTTITFEVLDENDNVLSTTVSEAFTMESFANTPECPSYLLDSLYLPTGFEPAAAGTYRLRATIASDSEDENLENNSFIRTIVYTTCEYGHEDETNLDAEIRPRAAENPTSEFDPTGYGCFYTFPNAGSTAHGISVQFGGNTDAGAEFSTVLYLTNGNLNDSGEIVASEEYQITDGQLNDQYHYYPFDAPYEIDETQVYFAGILNENQSPTEVTVAAEANSDSDNSTGVYERAGSGDFVWFGSQTWSPAVRLIMCELVSVNEINDELLTSFVISPNPAADVARINYTLTGSVAVAYEVRDIQGRVVEFSNLGRMQPGANQINLNVSNYAAGNYTVSLVVDGARMFAKQLNVTR